MPDPTPQPEPPATPPLPQTDPPPSQTVPLDRFNDVIGQARTAQKERDDAIARLQAIEDANKSEVEKAQSAAQREKARADDLDNRLRTTQRDGLVRAVASDAIDADAVIALISGGKYGDVDPEKPETATEAIEKLRDAKPNLFGAGQPAAPQPFGRPLAPTGNGQPQSDDPRLAMGQGILAALNRR